MMEQKQTDAGAPCGQSRSNAGLGLVPEREAYHRWVNASNSRALRILDADAAHAAGYAAGVAAERERWRLLLARIDISISGSSANAVTARDWAHDMDAVQQMLRDELRA